MIAQAMRTDLPAGTVTFLFTDIEGSTSLLTELGEAYTGELQGHRRILRACIEPHAGAEVDTQGDAFFVAFASAKEAIAAAAEAQHALAALRFRVRMGLHTGEAWPTAEGYAGLDVNRAARICAAGHGGQVLLSQTTRELVEVETRDLGLHRLKDLESPQRIFQLGDEEFPPLKTLTQTNLPLPPTRFLGRARELGEVLALLSRGDVRQLTLTGSGGVGKTRLAVAAASSVVTEYEHGVWWISLSDVQDPDLVLPTVAQVLGAKDDLASHIRDRRMLLLIDNFEQVVEAASQVAGLLARCPSLRCLATSREPLHIGGEHVYVVPPLAEAEAVLLFSERASSEERRVNGHSVVPEICRRLDCLPLAVELAAARSSVLSPPRLLERLEARLPLLTGGARDLPERHRTLRATIAWSHDLLLPEEQQLFARLAIFTGGTTLETAEAICDAELDAVQSLVERSLVRQTQDRFWTLQTIHEYARERLEESGELADLAQRHAAYFLELAERTGSELKGHRELDAIRTLAAEHANLRSALDWAIDTDPGRVTPQVLETLTDYWAVRGHVLEGVRQLERMLGASDVSPATRAKALQSAGRLGTYTGRLTHAVELLEESADVWERLGERTELAKTHAVLGDALLKSDDERAERVLQRALELFTESGDVVGRRNALHLLGEEAWHRGDLDRATDFLERSLELAREVGDRTYTGATLHHLADVALTEGDLDRAEALYGESLALVWEAEARRLAAYCLAGLAATAARTGRHERAAVLWRAVEEAEKSLGLQLPTAERSLYTAGLEGIPIDPGPGLPLDEAVLLGLDERAGRASAAEAHS
jgi:predicted ATPase/class 3 adenylate cyclase